MLLEKDKATLIKKPNSLLNATCTRVMIEDATDSIINFYENNAQDIEGQVIIVRTNQDAALAAAVRNSGNKVLFVFSDKFSVTSYFSGTCQRVPLTKALITRSLLN
jgi:hypothetical protein